MATKASYKVENKDNSMTLMPDVDIVARIFDHIDNKTTDLGQSSWREPVANYQSPERFEAELALLRSSWIVFCPSTALAESGDYIARDAAGVPLVVVRGNDGQARAFRNACRHRGVQVANGQGCASVFVCPYHGWAYENDGSLRSVPHKEGFPGLEKEKRGLVALDCLEENGLIFVKQNAGTDDNVAKSHLLGIVPDGYHVIKSETLEIEANWKLHLESSLEGYHIRSTHQKTFFPVQYDNLTVVEAFGKNTRVAFPYQAIEGLRNKPKSTWSPDGRLTFVYHLFPNVIISTFPDCLQVVILEPIGLQLTRQHVFLLADREADEKTMETILAGQEFAKLGAIEDREVVLSAQRGLASGANEYLEFGLFERAIGRFHAALTDAISSKSGTSNK